MSRVDGKDLLAYNPELGKFEGEINLTEVLYELGGYTDALGDTDGFGYYEYYDLTDWDTVKDGGIGDFKAAILWYSQSGFVSGTYYNDLKEGQAEWSKLESDYHDYCDEIDAQEEGN